MRLSSFNNLFTLLFALLTIISEISCLPTSQPTNLQEATAASPNPLFKARATLEKRDTFSCSGSAFCGVYVDQKSCKSAIYRFEPWITFTGETRRQVKNSEGGDRTRIGWCLVSWKCDKKEDYASAAQSGVSKELYKFTMAADAPSAGLLDFGDLVEWL
ncbi:hypothetical protein TWF970_003063 [Orbilia oligospora]|uniref:Uncharacterized protein n=1 Tax=Orbilia oligospora TaxID=2813651 RepID=A0A7C8RGG2_ORBOL|nr:hypothetical protein TWF970_003063 [Orbilia oligospora]